MACFNPSRFDHLRPEEVLAKIGELLAIAIGRLEERERLRSVATSADVAAAAAGDLVGDECERRIVAHLRKVGSATPRELSVVLGLTRRTVSRKLARLRAAGLCQSEGRTRMACYRLRTEFSAN